MKKQDRESDIEQYLVDRVKAVGGEVRKVKWIGRDGAPDRLVMLPKEYGPDCTIWVELKAPGHVLKFPSTPHERKQDREHTRMRKMGQHVAVIDSFEAIDNIF